jgi:hypothetical protein
MNRELKEAVLTLLLPYYLQKYTPIPLMQCI